MSEDMSWSPPDYTVDGSGRVVGAGRPGEPNNWGRWGDLDELGTTNLIGSEQVLAAASLIREGRVFSLATPLDGTGPVHATRSKPVHLFSFTGADFVVGGRLGKEAPGYQGSDDYILTPLHGTTHWDALAHSASEDALYNGFWAGTVESWAGAKRLGIQNLTDRLIGRGVLLDLARHQGVERLAGGHAITPEQLDACAADAGVEIRPGDLLLLRTGSLAWFYTLEDAAPFWAEGSPGVGAGCVQWLRDADIGALAADNFAVEVEPAEPGAETIYPLHKRLIRDLGLPLGELWWLDDLAADCAADGRYEFFLAAPPLKVTNASGAPVSPIAIK